ncbi:dehydrogenase [Longivirga aurantiaca]|uniref:Dehydrogenase n=1 Tax=Longivirga aurantiaca TaxID=1837743 RepID=A0ABW1T337_9ACTN
MTEPAVQLVLVVSLAGSDEDYDQHVRFLDRAFRIVRLGTDGDEAAAESLVAKWAPEAAAIAVTGIWEGRGGGRRDGAPEVVERLRGAAGGVPVTDGRQLHGVLQDWAVRHVQAEMPGYFTNARTVVLGGANHERAVQVLREHTSNIVYADLLRRLDVDGRLRATPLLAPAASLLAVLGGSVPEGLASRALAPGQYLSTDAARRSARSCDVIVATFDELAAVRLADLAGKTVVTSAVSDHRLADLAARDVDMVIDSTPQPFSFTVTAAVLEALMIATSTAEGSLSEDDLLDRIVAAGLAPRVLSPNGPRRKSRFAFVIHPLSQDFFRNVEPLATVVRHAPPVVLDVVEKAVAYLPPFTYGHVTGIKSPTGAEAEGWLISVGGTPRELMAHSPEFTYGRLLAAAETARKHGAQVMGLGAFTKVVGDAGVTVARQAPLPVTTGNSYSAAGALWAAHDAVVRLGLVERDADGRLLAHAMVVGATGSIGSVCARLLALSCDELWLVSPESAKLLALKHDIERSDHRATIHIAATAERHLPDVDLVVTATSGAGKRVLDIMKVKPGCVITDVARPLDLSAEDVAKRPDVLVIESGEIELPGDVRMRSIGLPPGVAYACLAETVVLALEGRYETFTVGREIEWEKVKEIYKLGLKHGMQLAVISGVNGAYTDADIARVRERALRAREGVPAAV